MSPTKSASPSETDSRPLMLHCCCGPCATACLERLIAEERAPRALVFSNSNLDSRDEFEKRLDALQIVAHAFGIHEVIVDPYRHDLWLEHVAKVPKYWELPERGARCAMCFDWSLGRTARIAQEQGCEFATSLTVSPHKDSRLLLAIGAAKGNFAPYDFKKKDGFLRSTILSKELGIYRQNYCGCEFSRQPRNLPNEAQ